MKLKPLVRTVALLAAVAFAGARAAAAEPTVVNVVAIPIDPSANVYYALDEGYFSDAGLDVHITTMTAGPQIVGAVASGAVDIGISNVSSVAAARLHGLPLRFIAAAGMAAPDTMTDVLLVAKDSPVHSAAELSGKVIGIAGIKSFQQVSASAWIDKHGGDSQSVKFVEIPFPEMGAALTSHRIDAAMTTEPFTTADQAVSRSLGPVLQSVGTNYMLLGWVATEAWLQTHQSVAIRFAAAIRRASQWANTHRKESAAILVKYSKLPPDVAAAIARSTYGTDVTPAMISPPLEASLKYGIIDKLVPSADLIWKAAPPRSP